MFKKILLFILAVIAAVLIYATTRPDTFYVERSIVIQAPPEKLYAIVDDFHQWPAWSPWQTLDPKMKQNYSGSFSGKGAVYAWVGNSKVGSGSMEILNNTPPSNVHIQLDFLKPMQGSSFTDFNFSPEAGGTRVTWTMTGPMPYISKVVCIFASMDKMIGKDFEQGLKNLKTLAE